MKKILFFILITSISCLDEKSGTKHVLNGSKIEISNINGLHLESVEVGTDPIFGKQSLNIILQKTYSEHFEKENHPNIWILPTEIGLELIEQNVSKNGEILSQTRTEDGLNDKSSTDNFMVKLDSITYTLIFNTKELKNKTYTIYFKSIAGESLKMRDGYFNLLNNLK